VHGARKEKKYKLKKQLSTHYKVTFLATKYKKFVPFLFTPARTSKPELSTISKILGKETVQKND